MMTNGSTLDALTRVQFPLSACCKRRAARLSRQRPAVSEHNRNGRQAQGARDRGEERSRILKGKHGIRRQPDITCRAFADIYLRDHADLHKRSADRDREILNTLNRAFGSLILHEMTTHRIEQFKRERLAGKWRGHGYKSNPKPLKPATVNRELDCLKSILSKAVEWGKLVNSPARGIKRLKAISGHSSTRMLERSTHPAEAHKADALATFSLSRVTTASQSENEPADELSELQELLAKSGGRQEARTPDLRVANAALSQLS
jgi:hypothetical protein